MKGIRLVIISVLLQISVLSYGQDTLIISKKEAIEKALNTNLMLKISQKTFEEAKADYRQSNSLFLPDISVSHSAVSTTNPLMAFGSKLNQEILTSSDFNPSLLNNPDRTVNYATRIEVFQPVFNIDGLYERQAAKSKSDAYALQMERAKEYLVLDVVKAYMQLQLAYKTVQVFEKANTAGRANLSMIENYFNQGLLQKTDLLSMQVRMSEITNQLQYSRSNVLNASEYLAYLFNEEIGKKVYKPLEEPEGNIEVENPQSSFSEDRKDLMAMDKFLDASRKMMQSGKMKFLPKLNAFGSYELYDSKLFQTGAQGYVVGAQLSWNIFDGYKSIGKMEKAKVNFRKSEAETEQYKAQSNLEFQKTVRQLKDAENKVNLAESSFKESQEAYKIKQNRFSEGLEKTNDLLSSEVQMQQKELEHLQAVFEYNYLKQYLQFLTK